MDKEYKYLFVYYFSNGIANNGVGNAYITRKTKINSLNDLNEIKQMIETDCKFENVVIMNYILVCTSEEND